MRAKLPGAKVTGGMDYDLFVQIYFGLVVCALSAGHALAILSAIRAFAEPEPDPALLTDSSVLRENFRDRDGDGRVEHAGYFEDNYGEVAKRETPDEPYGADTASGGDDAGDVMLRQPRECDDPSRPQTDERNETSV